VHEELVKHKRDAIEWGVIDHLPTTLPNMTMKDKTGLGLGWGRAPREGRGPKALKSVWRDWGEAEEWGTKWEVLSQEEVERREVERERASRRLRRETSKFQSATRSRRR
jgi:chromatin structure-remodeling complex subunit SFH1